MDVNHAFFGPAGLLRSGWRFAIFAVLFALAIVVLSLLSFAIPRTVPGMVFRWASVVIVLLSALLIGWLCARRLERLPFSSLGLSFTRRWFTHLIIGLVVGIATIGIAILIAMVFGGLSFQVNPIGGGQLAAGLGMSFIFLAVAAASEEALFRGYPFQTLARSGLAWLAILITSLFFARAHLQNPDAGVISTANTALAGIWFGIAYLKTRDLWFVTGLHLMWNWTQGAIFGIEVSGMRELTPVSLLKELDSGPAWLTGGNYGLEGGVVTTIALVLSMVVIYFLPFKPANLDSAQLR
ncbi:MAG TPA: type II CAAX endopeptidase family protein [Pyrinomonadaceae bacterium]|nr:type II CAAX endopeptidase family protein [Pyrinomonadaceae bacterium]